jgi:hypothetical protein
MKCRMMHSVSSRPLPSPSSRASRTFSHELYRGVIHVSLFLSIIIFVYPVHTHIYLYSIYIEFMISVSTWLTSLGRILWHFVANITPKIPYPLCRQGASGHWFL